MKQLLVNLYGGPGAGKSTIAARIFSELKKIGVNAELVTEFAKDMTWEESFHLMKNQLYLFANQQHRLWRLNGKVDVIVTDAPLLNSLIYGETSTIFKSLVKEEYSKYTNYNIFVTRNKKYVRVGRTQSEAESKLIDDRIVSMMQDEKYPFSAFTDNTDESIQKIISSITNLLSI